MNVITRQELQKARCCQRLLTLNCRPEPRLKSRKCWSAEAKHLVSFDHIIDHLILSLQWWFCINYGHSLLRTPSLQSPPVQQRPWQKCWHLPLMNSCWGGAVIFFRTVIRSNICETFLSNYGFITSQDRTSIPQYSSYCTGFLIHIHIKIVCCSTAPANVSS